MILLKALLESGPEYSPEPASIETPLSAVATAMGETLGKELGRGANGVAYATASGRVIKITDDDFELALATRLRTKRLFKHIVNIHVVRKIAGTKYYAILMDQVTTLTDDENTTWQYMRTDFFDKRISAKQYAQIVEELPDQTRLGNKLSQDFARKCASQRAGILRDFSELRIESREAHGGNMGWNRHGNLVHFDAWQTEHYMQAQHRDPDLYNWRKSSGFNPGLINRKIVTRGLGPDINPETT
jgi:hypothetical protein